MGANENLIGRCDIILPVSLSKLQREGYTIDITLAL